MILSDNQYAVVVTCLIFAIIGILFLWGVVAAEEEKQRRDWWRK